VLQVVAIPEKSAHAVLKVADQILKAGATALPIEDDQSSVSGVSTVSIEDAGGAS
jgi:hypothetical protein